LPDYKLKREYYINGVPVEENFEKPPVTFLIPHIRSQPGNCSISMSNISNLVISFLFSSYIEGQKEKEKLD
jgi:hypothetical protein